MTTQKMSIRLEYRLLSITQACCTKIVKGLAVLMSWLQRINKRLCFSKFMQLVALDLSFKIVQLSQLVFKFGYAVGERRLFLTTGERNSGGVHELYIHLVDCGNDIVKIGKLFRRLR